jgi:hypothetical protein
MNRIYLEAIISGTIIRVTDLTMRQRNILTREIADAIEYLEKKPDDCQKEETWDVAENIGERMKGDGSW